MKKLLLIGLVWAFMLPTLVSAQNPVVTLPNPVVSYNASSTISVTNTFQSIWVANTAGKRLGCTVQNNGTHTMYVYFGPVANADAGHSVNLSAGQNTKCNVNGNVLQDQVSITGTSGDAFFAAQQ